MQNKKTVVIGASETRGRYANLAVERLISKGHTVVPVGLHPGKVSGLDIQIGQPVIEDVHTITMYIRPELQKELYAYLLGLKPKRIIFNPGTENNEFEKLAMEAGVEVEEACTLVMLSVNAY